MLSESEIQGMKNLISAILRSAMRDADAGYPPELLEMFVKSDWCEQLCGAVGISWTAYKRDIAQRVQRYIENSTLRRLQTYKLVEVLKQGKGEENEL